jgi:nucleoside-diphosphate-sugar epimerase
MVERILVTGAGGFIGGRIVEVLHHLSVGPVRAGVRRWSTAARIGRLPIEIVHCDTHSAESVRSAMKDVRAVVHCARDSNGKVDGTRIVLEEAQRAGVEQVVHLSSVAVYGHQAGSLSEANAVSPGSDAYGLSKAETEELCEAYGQKGLGITVLRPTIVYGPHSGLWTVEFAQRLLTGEWFLPEKYTQGTCNLVYVDDLVRAVVLSLQTNRAVGQTFIINGAERPTWNQYFHALNDALGLPRLRPASSTRSHLQAALMTPIRKTGKFVLKRFQPVVLRLYQRSSIAKRLMRQAESAIRNAPTAAEFELYSLRVSFEEQKAREVLGYNPAFSMRDGIDLSVAWLRDYRYA